MASGDFTRFLERCYDQRAPFDAWVAGLAAAPVVGGAPSADDVVADAGGRLLRLGAGAEWLDGETRELFRAGARAHDTDRRGAPSNDDAERVWRELWRGGWAVVETLDGDGKRLLLLRRDPSNPRAHALDAREQRALHLLARGATYKHVALDLGIGLSTASGVVAKALHKLGFKSRVDFLSHLDPSR
jgi:DNA-binding CsgD family transcriptional regulator